MEEYLGAIKAFGFQFAPQNYAYCNGQIMSIAQNSALFSLLGTIYGGDGQTTFALPDLQGRVPVGQGNGAGLSSYVLGQKAGTENAALNQNNMPTHTHSATSTLYAEGAEGTLPGPSGKLLGATDSNIYTNPTSDPNSPMASEAVVTTVAPAGGSQPFSILSPYLAVNYCICISGIYPSRN